MEITVNVAGLDGITQAIMHLAHALKNLPSLPALPIEPVQSMIEHSTSSSDLIDTGVPAKKTRAKKVDVGNTDVPEAPLVATPEGDKGPAAPTPEQHIEFYNKAKNAIVELTNTKGRPVAAGLLEQFGAKTLPGVPSDKLLDLIAAAQKALA